MLSGNRKELMIIRSLTAMVLFLILAQANVWVGEQAHMVLAVGYRAFLIAAPLFMALGLNRGMNYSLAIGLFALVFSFFNMNVGTMFFFALGMAVTGYIAKYVSAHSSDGAADNKVALNIGSLLSGALLMFVTDQNHLLILSVVAMVACTYLSFKIDWAQISEKDVQDSGGSVETKKKDFIPFVGWSLIGVATGIKLTGIFTILPQYLLYHMHHLPSWYGSLIIINSLGVVFVQHRILKFLDRKSDRVTHLFALSAFFILALPSLMQTEFIFNGIIWVTLLTLGECALSRYDKSSKRDGYLFPKELFVGVGSLITVTLSRNYPFAIHWSGVIGALSLIVGLLCVAAPRRTPLIAPIKNA